MKILEILSLLLPDPNRPADPHAFLSPSERMPSKVRQLEGRVEELERLVKGGKSDEKFGGSKC